MQANKDKILMVLQYGLALVMCFFTSAALYGIYIFRLNEHIAGYEGSNITGYMWFFSFVVQLPYIVVLLFNLLRTNIIVTLLTSVPFLTMWFSFWYAKVNGMAV